MSRHTHLIFRFYSALLIKKLVFRCFSIKIKKLKVKKNILYAPKRTQKKKTYRDCFSTNLVHRSFQGRHFRFLKLGNLRFPGCSRHWELLDKPGNIIITE